MNIQQSLRQIPLVRICVIYILGICLMYFFSENHRSIICIIPLLLLLTISLFLLLTNKGPWPLLAGIFIHFVIFYCGMLSFLLSARYNSLPAAVCRYEGIILSPPDKKERSVQVDCELYLVEYNNIKKAIDSKVRLYLFPDSLMRKPEIGDSITFVTLLTRIKNAGNPDEFDYADYLAHLRIYYSGYVKKNCFNIGGFSGRYRLRRIAGQIQTKSIAKLEQYGFKGNELAVLSALATGNRDLLNGNIISNYASSGAMHILAVSGLHVGILFVFLNMLFVKHNKYRWWRFIRFTFIFIIIWFYAFITGLSVPVLRASIMFSLFLIGQNLNRHMNSYNILAGSALLILLVSPQELFKVGFQFSYLAVFGILFFQPRLHNLILFKRNIPDRLWQLITLSIAAQITTFPLSLFYFHQFPTYFILTNIIVIPVTWIIMIITLMFYLSLPLVFPVPLLSGALKILVKGLNLSVGFISHLPGATIANIRFDQPHVFVLYLILVLLILSIYFPKKIVLVSLAGVSYIFLLVYDISNICLQSKEKELVVYAMRNQVAISFINGNRHLYLTEGLSPEDWSGESKYLKPFWIQRQIYRHTTWLPIEQVNNRKAISEDGFEMTPAACGYVITYDQFRLLYVKAKGKVIDYRADLPEETVDAFLVSKASGYPRTEYFYRFKPETLIFCQNLWLRQKTLWKEFAGNNNLHCYDVTEQGAFRRK
jgi:competence protein ComEC